MRKMLGVVVLLLALSQWGCSRSYFYYVCNLSGQPLLVELSFKKKTEVSRWKDDPRNTSEFCFEGPQLRKIENLEEEKFGNIPFSEGQMVRDEAMGTLKVTLLKGQALLVHGDNGYERHKFESHEIDKPVFFPLSGMTLTGAKGRLAVEGDLMLQMFAETEQHHYRIVY